MRSVFVFLVFFTSGCVTKFVRNGAMDRSPERVIDAHLHTQFTGGVEQGSNIPLTQKELLKELAAANIVGAVAHIDAAGRDEHGSMRAQGVVYCAGIEDKVDLKKIEAGLKSQRYGCIKIYLGYAYRYAYDRIYHPVYRLAEKYNVPVVFHTGDTETVDGKVKFADPLTIDEVAVDFRKTTFVIAHLGNPWITSAAEVAYKNPNVYVEAAALIIGDLNDYKDEDLERYVVEPIAWAFNYIEDPSKFMFGTDWPLVNIKKYLDVYKRAIPEEHWPAVFHDNAVRVFKIKDQNERALPMVRRSADIR